MTALHKAAEAGHDDCVKMLLDAGADPNSQNDNHGGWRPLHYAARLNHAGVLQVLLNDSRCDASAKENHKTSHSAPGVEGRSALHIAADFGHIDCVKILLAATDPNCQDDDGWTPLHCAARRNHSGVLQVLLNDSRCDPSLPSKVKGVTVLHIAAEAGHDDCVKMLLDAGADVNCQDDDGQTPLYYAVKNNNVDIVQMLLNNSRCDPRNKGGTVLHIAVVKGYDDCVKMLLDAGADVNCQDDYGQTPLYYAVRNNNIDIVQMLLNNSRCDPRNKGNNHITELSCEINNDYYADLYGWCYVHVCAVVT
nr:serine/threonine-protein phosphatase 6 regulatory ankyrin repeat subunit B-like [Cherax quadricarinatus]